MKELKTTDLTKYIGLVLAVASCAEESTHDASKEALSAWLASDNVLMVELEPGGRAGEAAFSLPVPDSDLVLDLEVSLYESEIALEDLWDSSGLKVAFAPAHLREIRGRAEGASPSALVAVDEGDVPDKLLAPGTAAICGTRILTGMIEAQFADGVTRTLVVGLAPARQEEHEMDSYAVRRGAVSRPSRWHNCPLWTDVPFGCWGECGRCMTLSNGTGLQVDGTCKREIIFCLCDYSAVAVNCSTQPHLCDECGPSQPRPTPR